MASHRFHAREVSRREFLSLSAAGGAAVMLGQPLAGGAEPAGKTDVWVFHGKDRTRLMQAALKTIADNGGLGKGVRKLTLKVNAAWWRTPEQGANTHPQLVDAFLKGVKEQGIKEIVMPENPVDAAKQSFPQSGLLDVAKAHGVPMIDLREDPGHFKDVEPPNAVKLKSAKVGKAFLETDVVVNMPIAKHHGGADLTMGMKNWMGAVEDRRFFHRNDLHQCIADISSFIKPAWTITDAINIMLDKGPKGPTENMKELNLLIVSKDQVAADAYTSTLFPDKGPDKIKYLTIAKEMKLGTTDLAEMAIHQIEVS